MIAGRALIPDGLANPETHPSSLRLDKAEIAGLLHAYDCAIILGLVETEPEKHKLRRLWRLARSIDSPEDGHDLRAWFKMLYNHLLIDKGRRPVCGGSS